MHHIGIGNNIEGILRSGIIAICYEKGALCLIMRMRLRSIRLYTHIEKILRALFMIDSYNQIVPGKNRTEVASTVLHNFTSWKLSER